MAYLDKHFTAGYCTKNVLNFAESISEFELESKDILWGLGVCFLAKIMFRLSSSSIVLLCALISKKIPLSRMGLTFE